MKAIALTGKRTLEVPETAKPETDGQNVIIKVSYCGICGSDLHYWETGVGLNGQPGLIMGHEFSGTVDHPGARKDLSPGDAVTAVPLNFCGECRPCRDGAVNVCADMMKRPAPGQNSPGAYADYIAVRPDMVRRLPDGCDETDAALIEPAAVCLHAVDAMEIKKGYSVLITGGGVIGLLCAAWARIQGAATIILTEINEQRREAAASFNIADAVLDAGDPKLVSLIKKTSGGIDAAVDASGSDGGINSALLSLKPGGTLAMAGIRLKPQSLLMIAATMKEIRLRPVFGYRPDEFDTAMENIGSGNVQVNRFIGAIIDFNEVQAAFESLHSGATGRIKILIRP